MNRGMICFLNIFVRLFLLSFFSIFGLVRAEAVAVAPFSVVIQAQSDKYLDAFIEQTLSDISVTFQDQAILAKKLSATQVSDPKVFSQAQFIIASAPVFALLERYGGFSAIASIQPEQAIDADSASSTVILVRKLAVGNLVTFKSLKGSSLGILDPDSFETQMHLADELLLQRQKPASFFKIKKHVGSVNSLIDALLIGTYDAIAIPSSIIHTLSANTLSSLQVVEPRLNLELDLAHTTSVYPGWVFAASLQIFRDTTEDLGALLRSLPSRDGFRWSKSADYRKVHQVLLRTNDQIYKSLQRRSLAQLFTDYSAWIFLCLIIVIGLILHSIRTERLVQRRTNELAQLHREQQVAKTRYEQLEKASIVGQMSNLVAHELRQPLAAITNYLMGARRRLKNGMLDENNLLFALQRSLEESRRANAIVEHVQGYAKQKRRVYSRFDLSQFLHDISVQYTDSQGRSRIALQVQNSIVLEADALEIELCVKNLIKNAFEAGLAAHRPIIQLSAYVDGEGTIRICVADEGFPLSDDAFNALSVPFNSGKPDGLGLGLAIVRKITESYAGHLEFERKQPQGLAVTIVLPNEISATNEIS